MKIIEIVISPNGESRVQTKGFGGNECRDASQFLKNALGQVSNERLTSEFYQAKLMQIENQQQN